MHADIENPNIQLLPDPECLIEDDLQLEFSGLEDVDSDLPRNPLKTSVKKTTPENVSRQMTGREMLDGQLDPVFWTEAIKHASGDEEKAKLIYANWRQDTLHDQLARKERKTEALETRRMKSFVGIRKIPKKKSPQYSQAYFWEAMTTLSVLGICLTMVRVFIASGPFTSLALPFTVSVFSSACLILGLRCYWGKMRKRSKSTPYQLAASFMAFSLMALSVVLAVMVPRFAQIVGP